MPVHEEPAQPAAAAAALAAMDAAVLAAEAAMNAEQAAIDAETLREEVVAAQAAMIEPANPAEGDTAEPGAAQPPIPAEADAAQAAIPAAAEEAADEKSSGSEESSEEGAPAPPVGLMARYPLYSLVVAKEQTWPWWPGIIVPYSQHLFLEKAAQPAEIPGTICVLFFSHGGISQLLPKEVVPWNKYTARFPRKHVYSGRDVDDCMKAVYRFIRMQPPAPTERVVLARGANGIGWPWWPAVVVPFAHHLFMPESPVIPTQRANKTTVLFLNSGKLTQAAAKDIIDMEGNVHLIKRTGRFAEDIADARGMVAAYKAGLEAYKEAFAAFEDRKAQGIDDGVEEYTYTESDKEEPPEVNSEGEEIVQEVEEEVEEEVAPPVARKTKAAKKGSKKRMVEVHAESKSEEEEEEEEEESEDDDEREYSPPAKRRLSKRRSKKRKVSPTASPSAVAAAAGAAEEVGGTDEGGGDDDESEAPNGTAAVPWVA